MFLPTLYYYNLNISVCTGTLFICTILNICATNIIRRRPLACLIHFLFFFFQIEAENKDLEKKLHSLNKRATLVATNMDNQLQLLQEVGGSAREFLHSSQTAPPLPFDTEDSLG